MNDLYSTVYNPDVLNCLANLSNDEVFTPPDVVNQMLDLLPESIWHDQNSTFLDPSCKSGVFLREIAKRLITGLEEEIPELHERLDHIFNCQVFGIATTELCSLLSRRSTYCSKYPNSKYSVVRFDSCEGNVRYKRCDHDWAHGRCIYCHASQKELDRDEGRESYAYEFIHVSSPEEILPMKFDVIIGNPPYQLNDGGGNGSSATPIYKLFIKQAKKLHPRHLLMIIPARWQQGGKGLNAFRSEMLSDGKLRYLRTFNDSRHCFQGVDIAGGVCYFHWDRDYNGDCENHYIDGSGTETTELRHLNEFPIFIADNQAVDIVRQIRSIEKRSYDTLVHSRDPFGIGRGSDSSTGDLSLRWRGGVSTCSSSEVTTNANLIDCWKVITSKSSAEHAGQADSNGQRKILSVIEVLPPNTVCSETYLLIDTFATQEEAERTAKYLKTRFARYLVWQATPTQNISKGCFAFLPVLPSSLEVSDRALFDFFNLSLSQRDVITRNIKSIDEKLNGDE